MTLPSQIILWFWGTIITVLICASSEQCIKQNVLKRGRRKVSVHLHPPSVGVPDWVPYPERIPFAYRWIIYMEAGAGGISCSSPKIPVHQYGSLAVHWGIHGAQWGVWNTEKGRVGGTGGNFYPKRRVYVSKRTVLQNKSFVVPSCLQKGCCIPWIQPREAFLQPWGKTQWCL